MSNIELLNEYYNQTGESTSSIMSIGHDDMHDDQIIEGVDGYPDDHLDRHHDEYYNEY